MKRVFLTCLLACFPALAACDGGGEGQPVVRMEIGSDKAEVIAEQETVPEAEPTKAASSACQRDTFEGVTLTHCIADPAKHRIEMDLGPQDGPPFRDMAKLAAGRAPDAAPAVFAMNGGMFDSEGKPIGYYVENGKRLKELNRNDGPGNFHMKPNGVFFGTGGKWQIRTSDDFYAHVGDRPSFGTQSGPMLVIKGKLHPEIAENGPSKARRNGVGIDPQGRAHFVISEGQLSFGQLARYFRDKAKTPDALFLDGNLSALWDPASERIDRTAPLGPLIVVTVKE